MRALPGVTNVAFVSYLPMGRLKGGIWPVSLDGRPVNRAENQNAFLRYVTPGYFATLGIPIRSGRDINDGDAHDRQFIAVVSESFVKRYLPKETPASALGHHFTFALNDRVIAGVAGDVRMRGLEREAEPQVYLPFKQVDDGNIIGYIPRSLVVRTSLSPRRSPRRFARSSIRSIPRCRSPRSARSWTSSSATPRRDRRRCACSRPSP